jgi:hypothetical protein
VKLNASQQCPADCHCFVLWIESRLTFEKKKPKSLDLKIEVSCRIGSCCSKQKWFRNAPKYVGRPEEETEISSNLWIRRRMGRVESSSFACVERPSVRVRSSGLSWPSWRPTYNWQWVLTVCAHGVPVKRRPSLSDHAWTKTGVRQPEQWVARCCVRRVLWILLSPNVLIVWFNLISSVRRRDWLLTHMTWLNTARIVRS